MRHYQRVHRTAKDLRRRGGDYASRAGRFTRTLAVGTAARLPHETLRTGMLSVVVPFYGVEAYFDACIRSLRFQDYSNVQIILVDDGSMDGSLTIAKRHARRDPRIRIVRQPNAGLSAARNTGASYARGEFITFVDSDDTVRRSAYVEAIETLEESQSDFALMGYRRLVGTKTGNPGRWIRDVHTRPQQRASVDSRPDALLNAVAWSKVYRSSFFRESVPAFPVGRLFEDQPVSAAAFAAATAFDILPGAGINWRVREDRSSISQQAHQVDNMRAQLDAGIESAQILRDLGRPEAAQARIEQVLARNLNFYTDNLLTGGGVEEEEEEEFRKSYVRYADRLTELVGAERAHEIMPLRQRVIYHLAARAALSDLRHCLDRGWLTFDEHRVLRDVDGHHYLDSPLLHEQPWSGLVTPRELRVGPEDMKLTCGLRTHYFSDGRLHVVGWAYIAGLESATDQGSLRVWLQDAHGAKLDLDVKRFVDDRIDERSKEHFADHRAAAFHAQVELADLLAGTMTDATLYLSLLVDDDRQQDQPTAAGQSEPRRTNVHTERDDLHVVMTAQRGPLRVSVGESDIVARQEDLHSRTPGTLLGFESDDEGFTAEIELRNLSELIGFELQGSVVSVTGMLAEREGSTVRVHFPNVASLWGDTPRPLPSGSYYVRVRQSHESPSRDLWVGERLLASAPVDMVTSTHRVQVRTRNDYTRCYPALELSAPTAPGDRGWRNHRRLIDAHADTAPTHEGFFFRSLYGEVANCNGLGVHEEIRRQAIDVPLYWSVRDLSVSVPEGGIPVVEGTAEWHRAIRAAKHLLVNVHQHPWYRKVPGQTVIETFHGYPYKLMGHDWWTFRGFPARQVADFDDRARDWDYVVSPASYATPLLRHAFTDPPDSQAEYLDIGYPRNDVLLRSEDMQVLREQTRSRLKIPDGVQAVLYAPTFRDYLSADDMTANFVDLLDVRRLADELGPDHVLLMRGHPFNARGGLPTRGRGARIIDVTAYPDINHLYAASDAAILDYSSARFDYALTTKPMVFFVPDLEQYHENRPGLLQYRRTTPGPLLDRIDQVVSVLRHPERTERVYRVARDTFMTEFVDLDDGKAAARLLNRLGF